LNINELPEDYNSGDINFHRNIMDFLGSWIIEHILISDKEYVELFKKNKLD